MKVIGIDFGATYIRFGVVEEGVILKRIVFATPQTMAEIYNIFREAFNILHRFRLSKKTPVGVSSIGPFLGDGETIARPPNVGGLRINFRKIVKKYHDGEMTVLNDCTAAVLAEKTYGRWRGCDNIVYVTISTGIGGGVFSDGKLLFGKHGNAVEIGHIVVDYQSDVKCGCGGQGHWEALCSGTGLPKLSSKLLGRRLWKTAPEIFTAAAYGDKKARMVLKEMSMLNAAAFASIINTFDPEVVIVGGGVALNHPRETVTAAKNWLKKYELLQAPIVMSSLGFDASLLGASLAAEKSMKINIP